MLESGVDANNSMLARILTLSGYVKEGLHEPVILAVERFEARGMSIGESSIETMIWTGRFIQAWHKPEEVKLVLRRDVKLELCGTSRAKDANIRAALIDAVGPPGTRRAPGPTYGVRSHAWAALAVAVVADRGKLCGLSLKQPAGLVAH